MRKHLLVSIIFVCISICAYADETCDQSLTEAKQKYNAGNYAKAKALFEFVKDECGSNYGDVNSWISKCNSALNPSLSLSRSSISFGASSNSSSISVTSNRDWNVRSSGATWFTTSVNGNTINVSCSSNSSSSSRSSYFDVMTSDGAKSVRVSVSQSGASSSSTSLSVSRTTLSVSSAATTEYLTVSCNSSWEIQYPSATMYSVTRSGNSLTVSINANTTGQSRSDFFNVKTSDGSKVVKVTINQSAMNSLSVSKTTISCSASASTEYLTVTSNGAWELQYATGNWYSVTRNGNSLTVKINANPNTTSRSDYFNVKTPDGSKVIKITINQSAKSTSYSSSNSYATINNVYGEHNVYVNGVKGMKVHVKFDAYDVLNHTIKPCAYFYYADGTALKGIQGSNYITSDGKVTVQDRATASYVNTTWNDFVLFIPYSNLNMQSGCKNLSLMCGVGIYDETLGKWLTTSNKTFNFSFSN